MTIGFKIISEMTKEELIDEVAAHYRRTLDVMDVLHLRQHVVEYRIAETRNRLETEAELIIHHTPFGSHVRREDCDDENGLTRLTVSCAFHEDCREAAPDASHISNDE